MRFAPTVLAVAALTLLAAAAGAATTPANKTTSSGGGIVPYEPQKWVVSASLGFGDAGYYGSGASPMIGVCAEYGYNDKISIGASAGHSSSSYEYNYGLGNYKWTYGYTIIAARGSYHFGDQLKVENLDAYAGVSLGYNHVSVKSPDNVVGYSYSAGASAMRAGVYGGGRYWFSPKFAGFGEVGFGLGNLVIGVSTRF
jgi:hypothetical protein